VIFKPKTNELVGAFVPNIIEEKDKSRELFFVGLDEKSFSFSLNYDFTNGIFSYVGKCKSNN